MKTKLNAMKNIAISVLLLCGTHAYCEPVQSKTRAYYEKLHEEGCELCDNENRSTARVMWQEVARWANSRTNDVLRYKSAGNLLNLDMDMLGQHRQISRETYDLIIQRVEILEQLNNVSIPESEWGATNPEALSQLAKEARGVLAKGQSIMVSGSGSSPKESGNMTYDYNPYVMPIPLGMIRGLGTAVMSPCNIFMSWPASFELENDIWFGPFPLFGMGVASYYIGKDAVVGIVDFCTLGWVGNRIYNEDSSPWWWQRFGGKTKAAIFR